jgi:hypothetical protein
MLAINVKSIGMAFIKKLKMFEQLLMDHAQSTPTNSNSHHILLSNQ